MRKILLPVLIMILPLMAAAQIKWDAKIGVGTNLIIANSGEDPCLSYKLGGGANIPLGKGWQLNPALYYSKKGFGFDGFFGNEQISEARYRVGLHYLELPVNAGYRISLGKEAGILMYMGPYVAYGLSGKATVKSTNSSYRHTFKENLFNESSDLFNASYNDRQHLVTLPKLKRMEFGIQSGVELDFNRFLFGVDVGYALTSLANQPLVDNDLYLNIINALLFARTTPHNVNVQCTIGYRL